MMRCESIRSISVRRDSGLRAQPSARLLLELIVVDLAAKRQGNSGCQKDGGADKDRTCDLLNAIQALYQLSYDPIQSGQKLTDPASFVKSNFARFENTSGARCICC